MNMNLKFSNFQKILRMFAFFLLGRNIKNNPEIELEH